MTLVQFLPPESALSTAIRNDTPEDELAEQAGDASRAPWSAAETLLAVLVDETRTHAWMYASAHSEERIPRPEPLPRPGIGPRKRRKLVSVEELQRMDPRLRGKSPEEMQEFLDRISGRG
jgi:hypothetical protein